MLHAALGGGGSSGSWDILFQKNTGAAGTKTLRWSCNKGVVNN